MIRRVYQEGYSCRPSLEGCEWRATARNLRPELAG
jgi:hypothetical protein